jgi:hypothetical protein
VAKSTLTEKVAKNMMFMTAAITMIARNEGWPHIQCRPSTTSSLRFATTSPSLHSGRTPPLIANTIHAAREGGGIDEERRGSRDGEQQRSEGRPDELLVEGNSSLQRTVGPLEVRLIDESREERERGAVEEGLCGAQQKDDDIHEHETVDPIEDRQTKKRYGADAKDVRR